MTTRRFFNLSFGADQVSVFALAVVLAAALSGCGGEKPAQTTFATPEAAIQSLQQALEKDDVDTLLAIFGPESNEIILTGDPVGDKRNREVFLVAMQEGSRLETVAERERTLRVGNEDWPFPIPLVSEVGRWRFDTAAGKDELVAREIGQNELDVIQICHVYVQAQREYASRGHDGKPAGAYAQQFISTAGKEDGLYWKAGEGQAPSPLGELAAQAAADGYVHETDKLTPFHGYYFRILTAQGENVPDGARNYVVNGGMRGGFALVAFPARYGASGIMTFLVNHDSVVLQKDLGEDSTESGLQMATYNPDSTWGKAE